MNRFKKRRLLLARRKMCVRCGAQRAKPGCHHCADCLAVKSAKRTIAENGASAKRRAERAAERQKLFSTALARFTVVL